jgi:hypothetical protein
MTKEDVGDKLVATVEYVVEENVASAGAEEDVTPVMYFSDFKRPRPCNITNYDAISAFTGIADAENWTGVVIEFFNDKTVHYNGQTGAIRVRNAWAPAKQTDNDEIAFKAKPARKTKVAPDLS